ncbi:MAG: S1C family serine protease [Lachnospiraceae bacterium]
MSENNGYTDYNDYTDNNSYSNSGSSGSSYPDSVSPGNDSSYTGSGSYSGSYSQADGSYTSGGSSSAGNGNSYSYGSYYNASSSGTYGSAGNGTGAGGSGGNGGDGGNGGRGSGRTPEHKAPKKKGGLLRKTAAIVLSAVLFGGVAGSAMVGVQYAAKKAGVVADSETKGASIKIAETSGTSTSSGSSSSSNGATLGDVSDIVEKVIPSVVAITNSQIYENYRNGGWPFWFGYGYGSDSDSSSEQQEIEAGSGSGIIIGQNDTELLIVTNYHVIEDADSLTITFNDEATAKASVKGTDSDNDLAVVAVSLSDLEEETKNAIAIATMDTADDCKVGQGVIAIGNALGYGQSITVGYISALNREVQTSEGITKNLLQTDAAINPGNSGGALVNSRGEIIGINSAKYSDTDVEGMGFAIPISAVYDIIDDLMKQTTKVEVNENQRGYLGITCKTVDSTSAQAYDMPQGVYVYSILDGGAASKSELQVRDIITKINGTKVTTQEDLTEELKYYSIGDTVKLTVSRANGTEYESMEIEVTLAKQVKQ